MTELNLHSHQLTERWERMTLHEQLGNVGSEVARAIRAKTRGDAEQLQGALDRALELFDLTLADPRQRGRRNEICRAREVMLDFLVGSNEYASTGAGLDAYYLQFGMAARLHRSARS
jgi:hypothetical protein